MLLRCSSLYSLIHKKVAVSLLQIETSKAIILVRLVQDNATTESTPKVTKRITFSSLSKICSYPSIVSCIFCFTPTTLLCEMLTSIHVNIHTSCPTLYRNQFKNITYLATEITRAVGAAFLVGFIIPKCPTDVFVVNPRGINVVPLIYPWYLFEIILH